jgi:hypothetical protein
MRGSAEPKVAWENDKATVVALREIAMGYTDFSDAHHAESIPFTAHTETTVTIDLSEMADGEELIEITEETVQTDETTEITEPTTPEEPSDQEATPSESDPEAE